MKIPLLTIILSITCVHVANALAIPQIPKDFVIQTHRSGGKLGPENTLESCCFAWRLNTIPEVDVRTTRDGVLVAFHDKNFHRIIPEAPVEIIDKGVQDFTFKELQTLDVGAYKGEYFQEQRIPALQPIFEVLHDNPKQQLYLDIKDVSLEKLAAQVKEAGVEQQVILASTHYDLILQWSNLLPEAKTLLWMGGTETTLIKRIKTLREADFKDISQLQIHVRLDQENNPDDFYPSARFIQELSKELKAHGILFQALPWTSEQWIYATLLDLGVESFATDYPQRTRRAIGLYYDQLNIESVH